MPELRFTADTHAELVRQVQAWLDSTEAPRGVDELIDDSADLTKDALRIVAAAAPGSIPESDVVRRLTDMGYRATDATAEGVRSGLSGLASVTDGRLVKAVSGASSKVAYEMPASVARQLLKSVLRG